MGGGSADVAGGGGLGAGGAIFVQQGGTLIVEGSGSEQGGSVTGGSGGVLVSLIGASGDAYGSGIFVQGNETITFAPGATQTVAISDAIADMTGSHDASGQTGTGALVLDAPAQFAATIAGFTGTAAQAGQSACDRPRRDQRDVVDLHGKLWQRRPDRERRYQCRATCVQQFHRRVQIRLRFEWRHPDDPPPTSSTVAATPVAYAGHGQNFVFHAVSGFGANGSIDFAPSTSEANHIVNVHDEGDWTQPVIADDILAIRGIGHHDGMTPQQIQAMLSSTVHLH